MSQKRKPTLPGKILQEEYLKPLELTQKELADYIAYDVKSINRLVNGRSRLTPKLALRLAATFKTSPEFWLTAQMAVDLYQVLKTPCKLKPLLVLSSKMRGGLGQSALL